MAPRDAPEVVIKNLVRDAWDGTFDGLLANPVTPSVHMGWVDIDSDQYEVTISNPEESPEDGGQTGYFGLDGSGGGPVQKWGGTVAVNCWARRGWQGTTGNAISNPRQAVFLFKWMVQEILSDHATGTNAAGDQTDLSRLAPMRTRRFVETDEDPAVYRYMVTAGYGYRDP